MTYKIRDICDYRVQKTGKNCSRQSVEYIIEKLGIEKLGKWPETISEEDFETIKKWWRECDKHRKSGMGFKGWIKEDA